MLKNFNDLCGSCVTVLLYATVGTIGYKAGIHLWNKIETKLSK